MSSVNILEEISDKTESVWWSPDARQSYLNLILIFPYFLSFFAYFKYFSNIKLFISVKSKEYYNIDSY
jgi:hypothetical protein